MGAKLAIQIGEAVYRGTVIVEGCATTAELTVRFGEWIYAKLAHEQTAEARSALIEAAAEAAARVAAGTTDYQANNNLNLSAKRDELIVLIDKFVGFRPIFERAREIPELTPQKKQKLQSYDLVLKDMNYEMTALRDFVQGFVVQQTKTLIGDDNEHTVIWKILQPFIAAVGNLQRLASDVEIQNTENTIITDAQLATLKRGLVRVTTSLGSLAGYILGQRNGNVDAELLPENIFQIQDIYGFEERLQN